MRSQRVELACGLLGGALGLVALGVALFVPSDMICSDSTTSSPHGACVGVSLVQQTGLAGQVLPLALFGGLSLGIALFTLWHTRSRKLLALTLLWGCTTLLVVASLLSFHSAGVLFLPADVMALLASIAGVLTLRKPTPA